MTKIFLFLAIQCLLFSAANASDKNDELKKDDNIRVFDDLIEKYIKHFETSKNSLISVEKKIVSNFENPKQTKKKPTLFVKPPANKEKKNKLDHFSKILKIASYDLNILNNDLNSYKKQIEKALKNDTPIADKIKQKISTLNNNFSVIKNKENQTVINIQLMGMAAEYHKYLKQNKATTESEVQNLFYKAKELNLLQDLAVVPILDEETLQSLMTYDNNFQSLITLLNRLTVNIENSRLISYALELDKIMKKLYVNVSFELVMIKSDNDKIISNENEELLKTAIANSKKYKNSNKEELQKLIDLVCNEVLDFCTKRQVIFVPLETNNNI